MITDNPSNDSTNDYHYTFKHDLFEDVHPLYAVVGFYSFIHEYTDFYGECSYTGTVDTLSYNPGGLFVVHFNNWVTYAHSNGSWGISLTPGVDVEYPLSLTSGFTIAPSFIDSFIFAQILITGTISVS